MRILRLFQYHSEVKYSINIIYAIIKHSERCTQSRIMSTTSTANCNCTGAIAKYNSLSADAFCFRRRVRLYYTSNRCHRVRLCRSCSKTSLNHLRHSYYAAIPTWGHNKYPSVCRMSNSERREVYISRWVVWYDFTALFLQDIAHVYE